MFSTGSGYPGYDDLNGTLAAFETWRRRMVDRMFDDDAPATATPPVAVRERPEGFELTVDLPGLTESDVELTVHEDVVRIGAERKPETTPEGYAAHRQERAAYKFSRSFALGAKVDGDKVTASMKDGVLTVFLPRLPESQPRTIKVQRVS